MLSKVDVLLSKHSTETHGSSNFLGSRSISAHLTEYVVYLRKSERASHSDIESRQDVNQTHGEASDQVYLGGREGGRNEGVHNLHPSIPSQEERK